MVVKTKRTPVRRAKSKRAKLGSNGTTHYRFDLSGYVESASLPEYTRDTSMAMSKTFRYGGAVGAGKAKLPQYVAHIASPIDLILDYGAGSRIPHTLWLRSLGLNVVATDQYFDSSVHDLYAFERRYDIIMCSNVLNVQERPQDIVNVIYQLRSVLKPDGVLVVNYPENPRNFKDVTDSDIETVLRKFFRYVSKEDIKRYLGGYSHGWVCRV